MKISAKEHLEKFGIKPSFQRLKIMQYLLDHKTHPTIDEIYSALVPEIPTLSKTTVYNTLKLFVESNAVLSLGIDEKNVRYDGDTTPHAHFKCLSCGAIRDIFISDFSPILEVFTEQIGNLKILDTEISYKGICENCKLF